MPGLPVTRSFQDTRPLHLVVIETMLAVHATPFSVCCRNNPDAEDSGLSFYLALLGYHTSKLGAPESRDRILTGAKPFYFFLFYFNYFVGNLGITPLEASAFDSDTDNSNSPFFRFLLPTIVPQPSSGLHTLLRLNS